MRTIPLFLMALALATGPGGPPAPEFYMLSHDCKTTIGSLIDPSATVKTIDALPFMFACTKGAQKITCTLKAADGSEGIKGASVEFSIIIDTPPELMAAAEFGSDFVSINLTAHAFVMVTRTFGPNFAGSKICQGAYVTATEMELLQRSRGKQ